MKTDVKNIVGLSMKGGRKDLFYFCLLEYFPEQKRWFLKSLRRIKDKEDTPGDESIRSWMEDYHIKTMILDFPITNTSCQDCLLDCPGSANCPVESVVKSREKIEEILKLDRVYRETRPKDYEFARNLDDMVDYSRDLTKSDPEEHLISRSFKRRLKKGFVPYWNRAIDLWVWCRYYDLMLDLFNVSYDSFGQSSLMIQSRFAYLKKHFPRHVKLYESNEYIVLIELLKAGLINQRDLKNLYDIEEGLGIRLKLLKKIESDLGVFIYDHDLETLVQNPRAFSSFLMALSGRSHHLDRTYDYPEWVDDEENPFIAPNLG